MAASAWIELFRSTDEIELTLVETALRGAEIVSRRRGRVDAAMLGVSPALFEQVIEVPAAYIDAAQEALLATGLFEEELDDDGAPPGGNPWESFAPSGPALDDLKETEDDHRERGALLRKRELLIALGAGLAWPGGGTFYAGLWLAGLPLLLVPFIEVVPMLQQGGAARFVLAGFVAPRAVDIVLARQRIKQHGRGTVPLLRQLEAAAWVAVVWWIVAYASGFADARLDAWEAEKYVEELKAREVERQERGW